MKTNIYLSLHANNDFETILDHYYQIKPSITEKIIKNFDKNLNLLSNFPDIGSPLSIDNPRLHGLRKWPLPEFEKISLFYIHVQNSIKIIRILHSSQDITSILKSEGYEEI